MDYIHGPDRFEKAVRNGNIKKIKNLTQVKWYRKPAEINNFYNGYSVFDGYTPLTIASSLGNEEIVSILISKGANINAQTKHKWVSALGSFATYLNGRTALMMAAQSGYNRIVELLLENGALVNAWSSNPSDFYRGGWESVPDSHETSLLLATQMGRSVTIKLLEKYGGKIDLNQKELWGW